MIIINNTIKVDFYSTIINIKEVYSSIFVTRFFASLFLSILFLFHLLNHSLFRIFAIFIL